MDMFTCVIRTWNPASHYVFSQPTSWETCQSDHVNAAYTVLEVRRTYCLSYTSSAVISKENIFSFMIHISLETYAVAREACYSWLICRKVYYIEQGMVCLRLNEVVKSVYGRYTHSSRSDFTNKIDCGKYFIFPQINFVMRLRHISVLSVIYDWWVCYTKLQPFRCIYTVYIYKQTF